MIARLALLILIYLCCSFQRSYYFLVLSWLLPYLSLSSGSLNMTLSHIQKIFIAFVIALFAFRMPMSFWQKNSIYFLLFSLLLLILVFVPFIGKEVNGAFRWIRVLGFSFQPSELMKFSLIIYISSYCLSLIHI